MAVIVKDGINDAGMFSSVTSKVMDEVKRTIVGKDSLLEDIFIALLSEGNVLLEGVPGVAKTSIARTFAGAIGLDFKRVQFVPDLLPSDITGGYVYNQKNGTFELRTGPIFTNILLVDEINRASPKTQSSLLEAMEEKQVSIDGNTFPLPEPFMVITTQNPIDIVGTYPLPEAQIDRFLFKLDVDYPDYDDEMEILRRKNSDYTRTVEPVADRDEVLALIQASKRVHVSDKALGYIRDIIMASRSHEKLLLGGSPRASISLLKSSKVLAAMNGRDYVIPDDIKGLAPKVLSHRIVVRPEYELESVSPSDIVDEILQGVKVPS